MIYSNSQNLFIELIKYNESNIELLGEMQVPLTNVYYITMLDLTNTQINKFISYLTDSNNPNPFDNFRSNIGLDEEQISNLNLIKSSLHQLNLDIDIVLDIAKESNGKIVLVLDIGLFFNLIKKFKEVEQEIHLYDFILHKLKNKVDKLFILDSETILTIGDKHSSVFDEIKIYLCKEKNTNDLIANNYDVTIYKNHGSIYWKIFNLNQKIEYIHTSGDENDNENDNDNDNDNKDVYEEKSENILDKFEGTSLVMVDDEESLLTTTKISKLCFANLFEMHSFVLDPIDKLKIVSIYE